MSCELEASGCKLSLTARRLVGSVDLFRFRYPEPLWFALQVHLVRTLKVSVAGTRDPKISVVLSSHEQT